MRKRKLLMGCLLAVFAVLAVIALDQRMIVRHYSVEAEEIASPVSLALVTDFHGCDYGPGAQRLLNAIDEAAPDAVLLVGDIFDDEMPWEASEALVKALAQRYPCFYVTGNHEYWSGRADEVCRIVASAGATVLDMDCSTIEVRGERLNICGIPDPDAVKYAGAPPLRVQLEQSLEYAEADAYTLLLAHRPERIAAYAAAGFDLVLSGHAHGGQVSLPGLINGLYSPDQGFFPDWAGGLYRVDGTTMIVSRGLARESTRLPRVFNRPELVIVTIE